MKEIFKNIEGYKGYYKISNLGTVKSLKRKVVLRDSFRIVREKELKPEPMKGYLRVTLSNKGNKQRCLIHRLVAVHFIPNQKNKPQINHINNIKTDNQVSNLEWVTHQENQRHHWDTTYRSAKGEKNNGHKLSELNVVHIRKLKGTDTNVNISKKYGVTRQCIEAIYNGISWNA